MRKARWLAVAGLVSASDYSCLDATNFANTQYTVPIHLGSPKRQTLRAVPDTGSFELLVADKVCGSSCAGGSHVLFDRKQSSSFHDSNLSTWIAYGQGQVLADLGNDTIQLGHLVVNDASFLMMRQNQLRDWESASFDAVMGMGPLPTVSLEDHRPALMDRFNILTLGICYGLKSGTPGRVDLGAGIPNTTYKYFPALGKQHWGMAIDDLTITTTDGKQSSAGKPCKDKNGCAAIVDSGTSLIAMPTTLLETLKPVLDMVHTDCSNRDQLPNISFGSGENKFTLTPEHYVMMVQGVDEVKVAKFGDFELPYYTGKKENECMPAFMTMDEQTDHGPMIILGAPFLRAHAVTFDRSDPENRKMGVAVIPPGSPLCEGCAGKAAHVATKFASSARKGGKGGHPMLAMAEASESSASRPIGLSMQHLRFPIWMRRRGQASKRKLFEL